MTDNKIILFKHEEFGEIRTLNIEGEPWFVGKDVCIAFGDKNHIRSVARVDDVDKRKAAENNTSEDNSRESNSEIDKVIIDPENNSERNSENVSEDNSDNSDSNSETEVTSNAESV